MNFLWNKLICWFDRISSFFIGRIWARVIWVFGGISVYDTFSLDASLARWLLPRIRLFRKVNQGHPADLTKEEWDEILVKIEWSLESTIAVVIHGQFGSPWQSGNDLLGKHMNSLWW